MFLKTFFSFFFIGLLSSPVFAINVNLYEQPKPDSKVVGSVDSEIGIIPIFSPKDGVWVKVADPRNGNVGWIKSADLKMTNTKGSNFSFRVISTGSGPNGYQMIQFGAPQQFPKAQADALLKKIEAKQQQIQKDMQQMVHDIFQETETNLSNFPSFFPIVITTPQTKSSEQPKVGSPSTTPIKPAPTHPKVETSTSAQPKVESTPTITTQPAAQTNVEVTPKK